MGRSSASFLTALETARAMGSAHQGLILVAFRDDRLVAARCLEPPETEASAVTAATHGADTAIMVVVGSTRVIGRSMAALDTLEALLPTYGVRVAAAVHLPFTDGDIAWTDLRDDSGTDAGVAANLWTSNQRSRTRTWRNLFARPSPQTPRTCADAPPSTRPAEDASTCPPRHRPPPADAPVSTPHTHHRDEGEPK